MVGPRCRIERRPMGFRVWSQITLDALPEGMGPARGVYGGLQGPKGRRSGKYSTFNVP